MQNLNRKAALLRLIQSEHMQLEALLSTLDEEHLLRPGVTGSWSVKDVLAHLTWWEQAMISELLFGVELDPGLGGQPWSTERANALVVEAKRGQHLSRGSGRVSRFLPAAPSDGGGPHRGRSCERREIDSPGQ